MALTDSDLAWALAEMSQLRYFPSGESGEMAQEAIVRKMREYVGTREQLVWLVNQLTDHVGIWPGPSEVRGLFCTRFKPADGKEADCQLPGYSSGDLEVKQAYKAPAQLAAGDAKKLLTGIGLVKSIKTL